jgi:uncharacterized protein
MRLTKKEIEVIKSIITRYDNYAEVRLFGSRTDDGKKGGDIDLLVLSDRITLKENLVIKSEIQEILGDQRIDLLVTRDKSDLFVDLIFDSSIKLT